MVLVKTDNIAGKISLIVSYCRFNRFFNDLKWIINPLALGAH